MQIYTPFSNHHKRIEPCDDCIVICCRTPIYDASLSSNNNLGIKKKTTSNTDKFIITIKNCLFLLSY